MKINIAIADDHLMVINGIQKMLSVFPDIIITDTYSDGDELMKCIEKRQPVVLLLDIQMPGKTGDKIAPQLIKMYPSLRILVLTNFDSVFYVKKMIGSGALGYLLKSTDPLTFTEAIKTVYKYQEYIEPGLRHQLEEKSVRVNRQAVAMPPLSTREKEVLQLIADGYTTQEIANQLFIAFTTVENYRFNLLSKFGVKNTAILVKKAVQFGLVQ
jgi:DNA-binding NarL/FixJ family response regulator